MSKFTHLHTHSHYSLLTALPKIDDLVAEAKKCGMTSLAITDNGNLYAAIEFYKACQKKEIKPIIGVDFYIASRTRKDMQAGIDNRRNRLVLLAMNEIGYKNLVKLVTDSNLEGFYYKPRIDKELIEKYNEGLIAISPSFSGDIAQALKGRNQDKAHEIAQFYKNVFKNDTDGNPRLYIEITRHPEIEGHEENMKTLIDFARSENIPIMAAHDVYYLHQEDRFARETLVRVNSHSDSSEKISDSDEDDFSFISPERAEELFKDLPEALENTEKIANRCNLEIKLGNWVFPAFTVESGRTPDDELRHLVFEGFARRNVIQTEELTKRAEYELKIIKDKGYSPYFLVVADMLRFARENGILSNIRGSVSGSLVTYLSGITNINPIEYEIPFERFLNPDRPSAPDIDMDYADDRRDEVIEYVRRKYGADKVAQIGTFGTMMARGSVRDVARAMGYAYDIGDRISKLIPMGSQGFPMTIDHALEQVPELKDLYENDEDTKKIIDMAKKIEGCARHIGVHAAGVVVSPSALTDFTPLQFDPKGEGKIITQYDMYSIEEAGLLKFDFLGLKNLTIIADAINRIKKIDDVEIDVDTIPVDDKKTFEMLARGETADLFQLNGDGMTRFLKELKPSTVHDINAMVALYRPGPIQFIPDYIARKHDPSLIKYLDPALEKILKKTYGVLVYQDDLLIMAHDLAGYSWIEVDKFRKAVGKKIPEEMAKQKEKFISGCISHSKWSEKKAKEIWKWIEPFAAYGFNKAHSVSYGRVAYITAYLKAHFPEIYLSAVLTSEQGDTEKVAETIAECKRIGIPVLPPDVNESFSQFTVVKEEKKIDEQVAEVAPLSDSQNRTVSESAGSAPHSQTPTRPPKVVKKYVSAPCFTLISIALSCNMLIIPHMLKQRAKAVMILVVATIIGYFVYVSGLPDGTHPFRLGLDLSGGSHLVFSADVSKLDLADIKTSMAALRDDVERRINTFGVSEPLVQTEEGASLSSKDSAYRLIVELPGVTNPDEAASVIGATPKLEFRIATAADFKAFQEKIPSFTSTTTQEQEYVAMFKPTNLNGTMVGRASLSFDQTTGAPQVGLNFNSDGRKLFSEITKSHIGDYVGIFLDDHLIQSPVVREEIPNGQAVISGGFTLVEAQTLVRNLNFGALPVPIKLISTQTIGPSLGAEAIDGGIKSGLISFIIIAIFLLVWYRLPGLVAVIALGVYAVIMLALFKLIPVTLTAAGIAGFIITIGMAVDANILIFERMKEELARGRGVWDAMHEGFARAWLSIRDSNISSIITGIILYKFGSTSVITGFALVFIIGVLVSMFTAITASRIFLYAISPSRTSRLSTFLISNGFTKIKS